MSEYTMVLCDIVGAMQCCDCCVLLRIAACCCVLLRVAMYCVCWIDGCVPRFIVLSHLTVESLVWEYQFTLSHR